MLVTQKAATNQTVYLFVQDSSSTTGAGLTGLVYNSAGLVCYYTRPLAAAVQLTMATQTVTGAHSDGGFVEVDATNAPGQYRLDLSDAVLATGVDEVVVALKGATNMAPVTREIQLVDYDPNDGVRMGMTALPAAAADAAGGLSISDAGGLDLDTKLANTNEVTAARMATLTDWVNGGRLDLILDALALQTTAVAIEADTQDIQGRLPSTLIGSRMDSSVGAMAANVVTSAAINAGAIDAAAIATDAIDADALAADALAEIKTQAVTALTDIQLDHLLYVAAAGANVTDDSVIAQMVAKAGTADWDTYDNTTDSLEAISVDIAAVQSDTDDIQTRTPAALVGGRMDASVGAMATNVMTASALATDAGDEIADQVWDEAKSGHGGAGSMGEEVQAHALSSEVAGLNNLSAADVNAEVDNALDTAIPGSPNAGSLNERIKTLDDADIPARTPAALVGGRTDASVGAMVADVLTASALAAGAANEIADAMLKRDMDQVEAAAGVHTLCTAVLKAVGRIRNNAGTLEVYRTDGSTVHASQTITTDAANDPIDELTGAV